MCVNFWHVILFVMFFSFCSLSDDIVFGFVIRNYPDNVKDFIYSTKNLNSLFVNISRYEGDHKSSRIEKWKFSGTYRLRTWRVA